MTVMLRVCLIVASVLTMVLMMQKIRKSKVQIEDSIYWVLFSLALILLSVFPGIAYVLSDLVGTDAPSNFIFLMVIFLLLLKVFSMAVRISQLETRLKELAQRIALGDLEPGEGEAAGGAEMDGVQAIERDVHETVSDTYAE